MKIIKYENYVSEIDLEMILKKEGLQLVQAPTGAGKTYAIVNTLKKISKTNKENVYVIACPNRSQNIQNGNRYEILTIVGGNKLENIKNISVASMVYDKANDLKKYIESNNKNLILIIDEAHQIIDSSQYRKKALKELSEIQEISLNTIHLTATPTKLLDIFDYDNMYKLEPFKTNEKNNISSHNLLEIDNKNIISQIISIVIKIHDNINMPLVCINNIGDIKKMYDVLTLKGYKVGVIANETNLKKHFEIEKYPNIADDTNHILNELEIKEMLPTKEFDFIFATSIIECGINIKNTDIVPVNLIDKHLDFDSIEQIMARCRNKIDIAISIIPKHEENKKIKSKKQISAEIDYDINVNLKRQQNVFSVILQEMEHLGKEECLNRFKTSIFEPDKNLFYNSLKIKDYNIEIDKYNLVKEKFKAYYSQFYYNIKLLNKELKKRIKADKFKIIKLKDLSPKETKEQVKELNKLNKEEKKALKIKAKNTLKSIQNEGKAFLLEEYIHDPNIIENLPIDMQESIELLTIEETQIKLIKEALKSNIEIEKIINSCCQYETDIEIKNYIKEYCYIARNKLQNELNKNFNIKDEYSIIRGIYDPIMKSKGRRITKKSLLEVLEKLVVHKVWRTKKELTKANTTKLMRVLGFIYNIQSIDKGYRINSLKTV